MAVKTRGQRENQSAAKVQEQDDQSVAETPAASAAESGSKEPSDGGTSGTHGRAAADRATRHNSTEIRLPLFGAVRLPAPEELAFLGGVGVLAVVGVIEWPVAVVLGAGHALATNRRNRVVREFGEALEEA